MSNVSTEPEQIRERFKKLQATYRSEGTHTASEWPMYSVAGRKWYAESERRERFLRSINRKMEVAYA